MTPNSNIIDDVTNFYTEKSKMIENKNDAYFLYNFAVMLLSLSLPKLNTNDAVKNNIISLLDEIDALTNRLNREGYDVENSEEKIVNLLNVVQRSLQE